MRPYALIFVYRNRLRVQWPQELLAGLGIALAVMLVFATLVASQSIAGSASDVVHRIIGPATLQLRAFGAEGFDERLLGSVEALPNVRQSAPILEVPATLVNGRRGRLNAEVIGIDVSAGTLDGLAHTLPGAVFAGESISLSQASARALGVDARAVNAGAASWLTVKIGGFSHRLKISAVIGKEAGGALSEALAAAMPLESLQLLSDHKGRITRILVEPSPNRTSAVRSELEHLTAGRIEVAPADQDLALLGQALRPSIQASSLFAAIAILLGFMLAFNASLLIVPDRRLQVADMRLDGIRPIAILQLITFETLLLGICSALVGLVAGYALARGALHQSPAYLAQTFVLGSGTVVGAGAVIASVAAGILAALAASATLILDLRPLFATERLHVRDRRPARTLRAHPSRLLPACASALLGAAVIIYLAAPGDALIGCVLLATATVLCVPLALTGFLALAEWIAMRWRRFTVLPVALTSLRATSVRSLALAGTGSIALFGSVALGGAREDLLGGIDHFVSGYVGAAEIWLTTPLDHQATVAFPAAAASPDLRRLSEVGETLAFGGGYLDVGARRLWVLAWPPSASYRLLNGQVLSGNPALAAARIRNGGWAAISAQVAGERHVRVGGRFTLPSPSGPLSLRVAATITNLGWSPGAVLMSSADFDRAWPGADVTALGLKLGEGAKSSGVLAGLRAQLMATTGLEAVPAQARAAANDALASEGLGQLGEIATLLLIAAILALAAALSSAIWQQRASLVSLRLEGVRVRRIQRLLLVEGAIMLGTGCLTGLLAGLFGELLIDGYLRNVTGFPVISAASSWRPLELVVLVGLVVLVTVAVAGWLAASASPAIALEDE